MAIIPAQRIKFINGAAILKHHSAKRAIIVIFIAESIRVNSDYPFIVLF